MSILEKEKTNQDIQSASIQNTLDIAISNRVTTILSYTQEDFENDEKRNYANKKALDIKEIVLKNLSMKSKENPTKDEILERCKGIFLKKCEHLFSKDELHTFKSSNECNIDTLIEYLTKKIQKQKEFEITEKNPEFIEYTTTILLAQKMCNEFGIENKDHHKVKLLKSYITATKPENIREEDRISIDDTFFKNLIKQKKAKQPVTFIDFTHNEVRWDNDIHIKMWLYLLISNKSKKINHKNENKLFNLNNQDITTFTLTEQGCTLFERIFDASCKLHRKLINDEQGQAYAYTIHSMQDIQNIFLGTYHYPGREAPGSRELKNIDGFIDVTECLFHIGSHRLRGEKGKSDQFIDIIEKNRNNINPETRKNLFDLTPFWTEMVDKFKEVVENFDLTVNDKRKQPLTKELFMAFIDNKTMSWKIPVIDKNGNQFIFSGRCKELESIVNKMLNSPKYSHIDAFNDILGTRFELKKTVSGNEQTQPLEELFTSFMDRSHTNKEMKFYDLKGIYHENQKRIINKDRVVKLKDSHSENNGVQNEKTGKGYNELKIVFTGFEIQMISSGNNTSGNKDESVYALKKVVDVLRRVMQNIPLGNEEGASLKKWLQEMLIKKRYTTILDRLRKTSTPINTKIINDMCSIQLVHELQKEEIEQYEGTNISTTPLYLLGTKYLIDTGKIKQGQFDERIQSYSSRIPEDKENNITEHTQVTIRKEQLHETDIGKKILTFLLACDDTIYLYKILSYYYDQDKKKKNIIYEQLDKGNYEDTENTKEHEYQLRITQKKEHIKKKIEHIFHYISGKEYSEKINKLLAQIEAKRSTQQSENAVNRLFRDALRDKQINANPDSSKLLLGTKKGVDYIGKLIVSNLQKILNISGTYKELNSEVFIQLNEYLTLCTLEKNQDYSVTYKQGKKDFEALKNTRAKEYFEATYTNIEKGGFYNEYNNFCSGFLAKYIEDMIGKQAERITKNEKNNLTAQKIKPAKVIWLHKMYSERDFLKKRA